MSTVSDSSATKTRVQSLPAPANSSPTVAGGGGLSDMLRRGKRENLLKRGSLGLRGIALIFSLIAFVVMASNKRGFWGEFDQVQEYRYVVAVASISTVYSAVQVIRQVQELCTGKNLFQPKTALWIDFLGDQIMAYLLMSAASSAVPRTIELREKYYNYIFGDPSAAAISMSFLAFLCLALSAIIPVYKLPTQPYI